MRRKRAKERQRPEGMPQFISKGEMAGVLRCSVDVITEWVASGHFPPPALYPGPGRQISLWRLEHFLEFTETGEWPAESRGPNRGS